MIFELWNTYYASIISSSIETVVKFKHHIEYVRDAYFYMEKSCLFEHVIQFK